jgi:hypothetical protein
MAYGTRNFKKMAVKNRGCSGLAHSVGKKKNNGDAS